MVGGEAVIVAGIGCRRLCPAGEIIAAVKLACARAGREAALLAAPCFKRDQAGLHEAARTLGMPLAFVPAETLAAMQGKCPTRSARAARATGLASVAEACALAACGEGALIVVPRLAVSRATCALAEAA